MRAGAVAVSAVAFGWVVVQAQGGCGTEPADPAPPEEVADPADAKPQGDRLATPETPEPPVPARVAPEKQDVAPEKPEVYFSASKSGDFEFDDADVAGVGRIDPPKPTAKANNSGTKKPKAFFPASKSGLVRDRKQPAPNAPVAK